MENSGQHNLSIALRHILQQFMDSTNSSGHNNTDMTLPHDGYIQRLSWHFECDKCQYRAFYAHDMEHHKSMCSVYDDGSFSDTKMFSDSKSFVKKRKLGMPRRMAAATVNPPPLDDSDQDSQIYSSPAVSQPEYLTSPMTLSSSQEKEAVVATAAGNMAPAMSQSVASPLSLEAPSIDFDAQVVSPEYEGGNIADIEQGTHKALDFDALPSKDTPTVTAAVHDTPTMSQSESADAYDPDILEIKVEVDERTAETNTPPPLSSLPTSSTTTDALFSAGIPDNSVECMMAMFGTSTSQSTPNNPTISTLPNPPSLHSSTNPPSLQSHNTPPILQTHTPRPSLFPVHRPMSHTPPSSRPMLHSTASRQPFTSPYSMPNKAYRKSHPLPQLSMGNMSQVRTPVQRPYAASTSSMSASNLQPSGIKTMFASDLGLEGSASGYCSDTQEHCVSHLSEGLAQETLVGASSVQLHPANASSFKHGHLSTHSSQEIHHQSSNTSKRKAIQTKPASTALTLEEKFRCCQLHDGGVAVKSLCMQFNQNKAVIQSIIVNKQKIMSEWYRFSNPYLQKKQRALKSHAYAEINSAILDWYWASKAAGKALTGVGIQSKAKAVAEELGYHSFRASNGWLEYFWKRVKRQEQATSNQAMSKI